MGGGDLVRRRVRLTRRSMPDALRWSFDARLHRARLDGEDAWTALEEAHILSQPWVWPHVQVHGAMLRRALRERCWGEAVGQVIRFVVAGPGSAVGRYPVGNSGRASVSMTRPMPVPPELEQLLADVR